MARMDEFREEREAMKNAPLKERLAYFWEYNKLKVIFWAFLFVCVVGFVSNLLNRKEEVLSGIMLNRFWMQEEDLGCESFIDSYLEYRGYDTTKNEMRINSTLTYSNNGEPNILDTAGVNVPQIIAAQATAGVLDYMIADYEVVMEFAEFEYFSDLRNVFTKDELNAYEDVLIYSTGNQSMPVALDVTGSKSLSEIYEVEHDTLAIGMFVNSEHVEEFKCFAEYLLAN